MNLLELYFHNQSDYQNELFSPVDYGKVQNIEQELGNQLPSDYKEFLKLTNGFVGFVGESYCKFYSLKEIIDNTNAYCKEFFPWAIQIGDDGGGEMYVLDKRGEDLIYGILPCIGDDDFIPLGADFVDFIKHLYYNDYWSIEEKENSN